jgi:hypothetical protein
MKFICSDCGKESDNLMTEEEYKESISDLGENIIVNQVCRACYWGDLKGIVNLELCPQNKNICTIEDCETCEHQSELDKATMEHLKEITEREKM